MREIDAPRRPGLYWQALIFGLAGLLTACAGSPPAELGSASRGLAPCPPSPNCVSSLATEPAQRVDTFRLEASREAVTAAVLASIRGWPGGRTTMREPGYIRSEFSSRVFGFVDDVEFWWADDQTLHVRSASRLGYSDFGVNRKRIESLRARIREHLP